MDSQVDKSNPISNFRIRSSLAVAVTALVVLAPFTYSNLTSGHALLGLASLAILGVLLISAWHGLHGRYRPYLIFAGLVPALSVGIGLALEEKGIVAALWCYPSVLACYLMLPERMAWVANGLLLAITLPGTWSALPDDLAIRVTATLLATSVFTLAFVRVISKQQRALEVQANTDQLTGLHNRQLLAESLHRATDLHNRSGIPMSVLMLDLDHFKQINDSLGHEAGDRALRGVGEFLRDRMRGADMVFRLGGEEFLVLLTDTNATDATLVAEELRSGIEQQPLLPGHPLCASIGVATLRDGEDWADWVKRSDDLLYAAKSAGRNQVFSDQMA